MRDPDRIDLVLSAVREAWVQEPDLRLTQLLFNIAAGSGEHAPGFYSCEDDALVEALRVRGGPRWS